LSTKLVYWVYPVLKKKLQHKRNHNLEMRN
jgi:hypothetical protein